MLFLVHTLRSENLILHRSIATVRSGRRGSVGVVCVATLEVVGHLGIQLLDSLLGRTGATRATGALLVGRFSSSGTLGGVGSMLDSGGRLGLSLGLRNALSQALGLRDQLGIGNNDLDLCER